MAVPLQYTHQEVYEVDEEDYTFWEHSKFALPWLMLTLSIFVALICLSMWQSGSDIRGLRNGIPRDLEPPSTFSAPEGGIAKYKRNIRIAVIFTTISYVLIALVVFFINPSPVLRARINYALGILFIFTSILAWVTFGLDMNSERDARRCTSNPQQRPQTCESREAIATGVSVFDAGVAVTTAVSAVLLLSYTATGDWVKEESEIQYHEAAIQAGSVKNGVSFVRKGVTIVALLSALLFAVLLVVFLVLLHEDRTQFVQKDENNRGLNSGSTTLPGWPTKNTKLRYATGTLVIATILFNLIPLNSRVIAYILAFLYLIYGALAFAAFGLDVDAIEKTKEVSCLPGYTCVYHPYNATTVLDFIGATALFVYVAVEFFVIKKGNTGRAFKKQATLKAEVPINA